MSQEHLKTTVYAKFGGQTKCIMGNVKMVNVAFVALETVMGERDFDNDPNCGSPRTVMIL